MGEQILIAPFTLLRLYTMCLGDRRTVHPNVDAPVAMSASTLPFKLVLGIPTLFYVVGTLA